MMKILNTALVTLVLTLSGCASTQFPETPYRAQLIQEITNKSGMVRTVAESTHKEKTKKEIAESSKLATLERKQKINVPLPSEYWDSYEKNLTIFSNDMNGKTEIALSEYKEKYSIELSQATDKELEILANSARMENTPTFKKIMKRDNNLTIFYFQTSSKLTLKFIQSHLARMSKLDKQYNVCNVYKDCWK